MGSRLSDNGVGFIDSTLAIVVIVIGVSVMEHYRGFWFLPNNQSMIAFVTGIVIFDQMNYDKTTLSGVSYRLGSGWFICLAGAAIGTVSGMVRYPPKVS